MYQASPQLENAIVLKAPPYTTQGPICQNWRELQDWHFSAGLPYATQAHNPEPIAVHTLGTGPEHNIFSCKHVHYAFRAWHDYLHLVLGQDFGKAGELAVCKEHVRSLRRSGVPAIDRRAVWAFTSGEVAHYWAHGNFIDYKREFVTHWLLHGASATLAKNWGYGYE